MATISNFFIDHDADFTTTVTINVANNSAFDLTNYTAAATLRKSYKSSSSTSFTVAFASPRSSGQITLSLTDVQTGALNEGRYVYDLVITDSGGDKTRVVEGIATIKPSVTR